MLLRLTIMLTLISSLACGQSFDTIDKSGTFGIFSMDSHPNEYKGLRLDLTISYGLKYYKYHGRDFKSIYDFKIYDSNVGFRNDKLEYVDFYFKFFDERLYQEMLDSLETDYGPSVIIEPTNKGMTKSNKWEGTNLVLQLAQYNNDAIDFDDRNKTVLILMKKR